MLQTCLLLTLICVLPTAAAQESEETRAGDSKADAARILAIIDSVVEHHIDPPTRHQLVHEFCRTLSGKLGLARRTSKARSSADLRGLIEEVVMSKSPKQATDAISEVLARPPIGVGLSTADNHKINKQVAENRYVGTGIQLAMQPKPVMAKVFENGPAHKVGAQDGDIIESIDGESTDGLSIGDVVTKLRGPAGSEVEVTLRQPTASKSREYTITRGLVPMRTISKPIYSDDDHTAYLKFTSIAASAVHELRKIASNLRPSTKHLIFDFRGLNNHNLHHAKLLASALLDDRPLGSILQHDGNATPIQSEPGSLLESMQITVVIGSQTSGTPEWIAMALLSNRRANLYGQATAGFAFVTQSIPAADEIVAEIPTGYLQSVEGKTLVGAASVRKLTPPIQSMTPGGGASNVWDARVPHQVHPNISSGGPVERVSTEVLLKRVARLPDIRTTKTRKAAAQ